MTEPDFNHYDMTDGGLLQLIAYFRTSLDNIANEISDHMGSHTGHGIIDCLLGCNKIASMFAIHTANSAMTTAQLSLRGYESLFDLLKQLNDEEGNDNDD